MGNRLNLATSGRKKTSPSILKNDDNFWNLYEKKLGIVKEEPKEIDNSKVGSNQRKSSKDVEECKSSYELAKNED